MLPETIRTRIIESCDISVDSAESVSGGSINHALKLHCGSSTLFLKWNANAPDDFFLKEAEGLELLKAGSTELRVPEVIQSAAPHGDRPGFLLMEWINPGSTGDAFQFGEQLARLHQTKAERFGLNSDNYIGSLPQSNKHHAKWLTFFADERIGPQLKRAVDSGKMEPSIQKNWFGLLKRLDAIIPPTEPSLLHGDLWGGNYLFDEDGRVVLIDPAVYYGHPEMDLAFTKMFGGFDPAFYDGYGSITEIEADFKDRIQVYNLYPLLVHVNLFDGHYTLDCRRFLKKF
ncbi:fructosamine kinase [Rhodohalobacter sp. SW132]|uniref:fructosamine kinase family protein n=1 Tax=Rhodohalobacter sp. SW132 TaxID=2293433 RepID=UPI000E23D550|nr:fructosamine kinase family protein [Rhodohalobacter sp. SW132]REL38802.1 fructosamine kinase [Rhodohalobacter sp. SW132]